MRRVWWLVIGGGLVLIALVAVLGFLLLNNEEGDSGAVSEGCTPGQGSPAAGNANVDARALGKGYLKKVLIRVTDKKSGAPLHGAQVRVNATMDCPHYMPLYVKALREAPTGTYKGDYQLVMPGHWIFHVVVRSKQNGATTASFPITMTTPG